MRSPSGDDPPTCSVRYDVRALSSPGLLSTVLAPFARRSLIPNTIRAIRDGDTTVVEIVLEEMPAGLRSGCEASLRQLVDVVHVGVMSVPQGGQDAPDPSRDQPQAFFR